MAEVLLHFDEVLPTTEGPSYTARACGREADDGRWEGWIELLPDDGSEVLRTPRETTQPDRAALAYWASGLTRIYLEGALARALEPPRAPAVAVMEEPAYPGPAPDAREPVVVVEPQHAVIDPFSVYAKGEDLLRRELSALDAWHLRNVVKAYDFAEPAFDLQGLDRPALVELIVSRVRERAATSV